MVVQRDIEVADNDIISRIIRVGSCESCRVHAKNLTALRGFIRSINHVKKYEFIFHHNPKEHIAVLEL